MISTDFKKKMADSWFSHLQIQICKSFELLENNKFKFSKRVWCKKNIKEGGGTSYFKGKIGPCQVYNRALSASEVLFNYNGLKSRFGL